MSIPAYARANFQALLRAAEDGNLALMEQDGSEVKSVELEHLTAEGQTLLERRDAFELTPGSRSRRPAR